MSGPGREAQSVLLASASPRRRLLLNDAGIQVRVHPPDIDDGQLRSGAVPAEVWVMALAYLKARRVQETLDEAAGAIVLGADTVCVHHGRILGQPRDEQHARWMLQMMRNATHHTISGVCLLSGSRRLLFFDRAEVRIGDLSDAQIEQYIASGNWRGKAGAYNLAEQIAAGWPIDCTGDPTTVMGLPMRRLQPMLAAATTLN
jgi:septum formation protein